MKVTALLLIAIVCVSSSSFTKRLGKSQTMAALAQAPARSATTGSSGRKSGDFASGAGGGLWRSSRVEPSDPTRGRSSDTSATGDHGVSRVRRV